MKWILHIGKQIQSRTDKIIKYGLACWGLAVSNMGQIAQISHLCIDIEKNNNKLSPDWELVRPMY